MLTFTTSWFGDLGMSSSVTTVLVDLSRFSFKCRVILPFFLSITYLFKATNFETVVHQGMEISSLRLVSVLKIFIYRFIRFSVIFDMIYQ